MKIVMVRHTLNKSHRWGVTLSKAKRLDVRSESAFLTQNLRFFVASLLRMTTDAIWLVQSVVAHYSIFRFFEIPRLDAGGPAHSP